MLFRILVLFLLCFGVYADTIPTPNVTRLLMEDKKILVEGGNGVLYDFLRQDREIRDIIFKHLYTAHELELVMSSDYVVDANKSMWQTERIAKLLIRIDQFKAKGYTAGQAVAWYGHSYKLTNLIDELPVDTIIYWITKAVLPDEVVLYHDLVGNNTLPNGLRPYKEDWPKYTFRLREGFYLGGDDITQIEDVLNDYNKYGSVRLPNVVEAVLNNKIKIIEIPKNYTTEIWIKDEIIIKTPWTREDFYKIQLNDESKKVMYIYVEAII